MNKQKYTYNECYSILNSHPNCSWQALRKNYKSQIQKWHPDRISSTSIDIKQATKKITQINIAFQQLEQYYKKHDRLPTIRYDDTRSQLHSSMYKEHFRSKNTTHTPDVEYKHRASADHSSTTSGSKNLGKLLLLLSGIAYIGYILLFTQDNPQIRSNENNLEQQNEPTMSRLENERTLNESKNKFAFSNSPLNNNDLDKDKKTNKTQYFSYGSTVGEVISVQGAPDNIKGNIWYYGNSEVHFKDGVVVNWERSSDSLLYIRVTPVNKPGDKK